MKKSLMSLIIGLIILTGCGGGGTKNTNISDTNGTIETNTTSTINHPPIAHNTTAWVETNSSVDINLSSYISDSDKDNLVIVVNGTTTHGRATNSKDIVTYVPNRDYNGTDIIDYTVTDSGGLSSTAQITVMVLPPAQALPLYKQSQRESLPFQYQFAIDKGAKFHTTPDGKSFYLEWYPDGVSAESHPPMVVTISGHAGWVYAEFYHLQSHIADRGYGIIALQWWFGSGEGREDYYLPNQMYPIFETILRDRGVAKGKTLLHGFSRGSANIYGVTLYDRLSNNNFFALTIANSGKADPSFSPNDAIESGEFGATPLDGTHWVTVCGQKDIDPNHTCEAIQETNEWIARYGGVVDLFIQDEEGDHEAFYTNPNNIELSLDIFDSLIEP